MDTTPYVEEPRKLVIGKLYYTRDSKTGYIIEFIPVKESALLPGTYHGKNHLIRFVDDVADSYTEAMMLPVIVEKKKKW